MLVENQNNNLNEGLQNLDQIPDGFDFSADAVWLQLESKLLMQKKPSRMQLFTKYLVAASIILAISLTAFLLIRKQVPIIQTSIVSKENKTPIQVVPELIVSAKNQATRKEFHKYSTTNKSEAKVAVSMKTEPEPILVISEPNQQLQQPISETIAANTTNTVAGFVEKKKVIDAKRLPIIHINELNRTPEPIYSKSNNKNIYLNETEDIPLNPEHPKPWWQPKPKPVNPIISLTDNQ